MRLIGLAVALAISLVAVPLVGEAQRAEIPKVGVITPSSRDSATSRGFQEAFERGLRELGWNPGRNIVIEYRFAEGSEERLSAFAAELARLPADIIVARGIGATRTARRATTTIPIVMSAAGVDPVQSGLVSSLARPGGNITGLTLVVQELDGKRLQLIKETIPRLNRVAFLANPASPNYDHAVKDIVVAAQSLGVPLSTIDAREAADLDRAFAAMTQARVDSLVVQADVVLFERHQPRIIALAARHRLPVMYPWREYTDQGGLMSYSASLTDAHYRAASYVNQILKGSKPGDLPVQQPTKFDLVINLKTAKALGLTIPPSILGRADQIIE